MNELVVDQVRAVFMKSCREASCDCPLPVMGRGWRKGCSLKKACYTWEAKKVVALVKTSVRGR